MHLLTVCTDCYTVKQVHLVDAGWPIGGIIVHQRPGLQSGPRLLLVSGIGLALGES